MAIFLSQILSPSDVLQTKLPLKEISIGGLADRLEDVGPQYVFFAIRGFQKDGNEFSGLALKRGAACVISENKSAFQQCPQSVLVSNVRRCLGTAASRFYEMPSQGLKLIGVTGTNGKTTVTFLLRQLWEKLGYTTGIIGTIGTFIGKDHFPSDLTTPSAISLQKSLRQMCQSGITHAAMEVSSIALDQYRTWGTQFSAVALTNLTQDHLDYHHTMEAYFLSKKRLFEDYKAPVAIFNVDDPYGKILYDESKSPANYQISCRTDSRENHPNDRFIYISPTAISSGKTEFDLLTHEGRFRGVTSLIGRHNLSNLAIAIAFISSEGVRIQTLLPFLTELAGPPGRLERVLITAGIPQIYVDYAHTPDALSHVLSLLNELVPKKRSRLFVVFGCGGNRDPLKRPKMGEIASRLADVIWLTSDNPRREDPEAILSDIRKGVTSQARAQEVYCEIDRRKAIESCLRMASSEDVILIAGKGHETTQVIGDEKVAFDDREVVRSYYQINNG